jgi:hypothetical protein
MGWNDWMDNNLACDECEDCEQECTEHEELCSVCNYYPCACDNMYEAWKERQYED